MIMFQIDETMEFAKYIYISKPRDRCPEDMTHRKESPLNSGDFPYGTMCTREDLEAPEADLLPGAESRTS
jgi:hypothetical protein